MLQIISSIAGNYISPTQITPVDAMTHSFYLLWEEMNVINIKITIKSLKCETLQRSVYYVVNRTVHN